MKTYYIIYILAILSLIIPKSYAQDLKLIDKIIVKVDNHAIYTSDLENAVNAILSQDGGKFTNLRCQVLQDLILQKVLLIRAEQDSVIVQDIEVEATMNRKFDYYISQFGSEENLEKYYGKTIGQFKQELNDKEKEQLTVSRMKGVISEKITVTPKEVQEFYRVFDKDSLPFFSKEVSVAEIVIKPKVRLAEDLVAKNQLTEIREKILVGASFKEMAIKYSDEPSAKQSGGDLGMQPRGVMDPKYEAAALSLKMNDISNPFKTSFGWHIVQLLERNGNLYHSRHILIMPKITESDIKKARYRMDSIVNLVKKDSVSFVDVAKNISDNKMTAPNGGYYVSASGELNISVKEIDTGVFFAVDTLEEKQYSRIHKIRERDGKEAFRVLYLDNVIDAHRASLEEDYEKLYQAALNEKKESVIKIWFKEAINNVYLDIAEDYDYCKLKF